MPSSYEFLTFSNVNGMKNAPAKRQIRQHAMKDIGVSRRKSRGRKYPLHLYPLQPIDPCAYANDATSKPTHDRSASVNDTALYDPYVRTMSCKMDPFGTASVPIDATIHGLLRYFTYYSSNFPNNFTYTPSIVEFLTHALQDDLLIHCVLSAAASRIQYVEHVAPPSFRERELVSTHYSVKLLQGQLQPRCVVSHASRERLLNCMLYLGAGSIYRQDLPSAKIHISAAVKLLQMMGGVSTLQNPQVLVRAISLDDLLACIDLVPCKIKPTYDPGGLPLLKTHGNQHKREVGTLPIGFSVLDPYMLPPALRSLVLHVIECHETKCSLEAADWDVTSETMIQRQQLKLRTLATRNRLLSLELSDSRVKAIRLSLIMCTLLPPSDVRQIRTAQGIARRLMHWLERPFDPRWKGLEQIKFWCLLIGYYCAQPGGAAHEWFVTTIRHTIRNEGTLIGVHAGRGLLSDLSAFQEQFLFEKFTLKRLTETLVENLLTIE